MGTITFEAYHIAPTSPRNTLTTIYKSIWFFFCFSFSLHVFLLSIKMHIMHGHIRERKEMPIYVSQTSYSYCASVTLQSTAFMSCTQLFYDERFLVVRWLFMSFSYNFLVLPIKKSDIDMSDKRLTKSYKSHNEPQSSHCLVVHEDAHLSYKRYKVKKPYFIGHSR